MATRRPDRSQYAASPLAWREYGLILMQLVLLTTLVWQFHLEENRHLLTAMLLATAGFAIHARLPPRYRGPGFVALSVGAIALVLGFQEAARLLAIAAGLILIARLPVAWIVRVILLGLAVTGLVWFRRDSPDMFWPIVGLMFMFRLLIYMQAERRHSPSSSLLEASAYFLMWPNLFFPLFLVVDYRAFQDAYYNAERRQIYQGGIHWLTMGLGHLVLYRFIKHELLPSPLEIRSLTDTALFLSMNYALYLRVSGHFHVICGLLHLFGYNLPRTHDCYFLASSFSDVWRRINIYWKDFMMKSFFFPAYFRLRFWGNRAAVAFAVLWVFLWTWLGHSWQAFWLLGDFSYRAQDIVLWLSVGALVAINGVIDFIRAQRPARPEFSLVGATVHALQVIGVFACVSAFWAQWSNPEVLQLLLYSTAVISITARDAIQIGGVLAAAVVTGVIYQSATRGSSAAPAQRRMPFEQSVAWHVVPLVLVLLLSQPPAYGLLGERAAQMIAGLQADRISRGESLAQIAGYYEELNDGTLQASPFLGDPKPRRVGKAVDFSDLIQHRDDLLGHELIPRWSGSWQGAPLTINRWGMRDRDRELVKPPGTVRIAVVGTSVAMGYGVRDHETFSRILEDRLNADGGDVPRRVEVLNFGVGRYSPVHRRLQIEHKALPFEPDLILYCAHQDEIYTSAQNLAPAAFHKIDLEDPCLDAIVHDAGIRDGTSEAMARILLERHHIEILRCVYRRMAATADRIHAELVHVYLPIPGDHSLTFDPRFTASIAKEAGLETVDLSGWEGTHPVGDVMLLSTDHHPSALGHRLLAMALEPAVRQHLEQIQHHGNGVRP